MSMFSRPTSISRWPAACTASVWKRTFLSRHSRPDVGNGLNGANLVVGIHDGHKTCVVRDGLGHLLGGDAAGLMDIQQGDGEALLLQLLEGVEDGVVLKGSGNDVGLSPRLSPAGGGENGLVVRLAATRGKVDLLRPAVKAVRHGLPGLCQGFSGLLAREYREEGLPYASRR